MYCILVWHPIIGKDAQTNVFCIKLKIVIMDLISCKQRVQKDAQWKRNRDTPGDQSRQVTG